MRKPIFQRVFFIFFVALSIFSFAPFFTNDISANHGPAHTLAADYWIDSAADKNLSVAPQSGYLTVNDNSPRDCAGQTYTFIFYVTNTYNSGQSIFSRSIAADFAWPVSIAPDYGNYKRYHIGGPDAANDPDYLSPTPRNINPLPSRPLPTGVTSATMSTTSFSNTIINFGSGNSNAVSVGTVTITFSPTFKTNVGGYNESVGTTKHMALGINMQVQNNSVTWPGRNFSYNGLTLYCAKTSALNNAPPTPTLIAPANGTGVVGNWLNASSPNPTFTARVTDPDAGDTVKAYFNFAQVSGYPVPPADQNGTVVSSGSNSTWTSSLVDGKYDWRAKAIDSKGAQSGYTGYWRVKKDTVPPTASCTNAIQDPNANPPTIRIASVSATDLRTVDSGVASIKVQRSTNGGSSWQDMQTYAGSYPAGSESYYGSLSVGVYSDSSLTAGTPYIYHVIAYDGAGNASSPFQCGNPGIVFNPPGFTITCQPSTANCNTTIDIPSGVTTAYTFPVTFLVKSTNGSNQSVDLSTSLASRTGFSGTAFNPTNILISPGIDWTPTLIISATLSAITNGTNSQTFSYTVTGNNGTSTVQYSTNVTVNRIPPSPWIRVAKGNVGSIGPIYAVGSSDYLLITNATISNFSSLKSWLVQGTAPSYGLNVTPNVSSDQYSSFTPPTTPPAMPLDNNLGNLSSVPTNGKILVNSAFIVSHTGDITYNGSPTVVFVNGNLTINNNLIIDAASGIVFIVNGNVDIAQGVTTADGVYYVTGRFRTNSAKASCTGTSPAGEGALTIHGAVYVTGQPCFNRNLADNDYSNVAKAAETIIYEPKYLWLFRDTIGSTRNIFNEVAP